jgi:hypothetical protein
MSEEKETLVVIEGLGTKKGIGKYRFLKDADYEYPITKIPEEMANKIIESNKRDQLTAEKRRKKMLEENKHRKTINEAERDPKKKLPLLSVPDEVNLENIRIGIPLGTVSAKAGRPKKVEV